MQNPNHPEFTRIDYKGGPLGGGFRVYDEFVPETLDITLRSGVVLHYQFQQVERKVTGGHNKGNVVTEPKYVYTGMTDNDLSGRDSPL